MMYITIPNILRRLAADEDEAMVLLETEPLLELDDAECQMVD